MKYKIGCSVFVLFCLFPLLSFASHFKMTLPKGLYVHGELGGSLSKSAQYTTEGGGTAFAMPSDFRNNIGNSMNYGFSVGRKWQLWGVEFAYNNRPNFLYKKSSPEATGGGRRRWFTPKNETFMGNIFFYPAHFLSFFPAKFNPFLGGGVGFAHNKIIAFKSENITTPATNFRISDGTKTSITWQVMLGLSYAFKPQLAFDLGYRYIDLGKFKSGRTLTSYTGSTQTAEGETNLLIGRPSADEIFLGLTYSLS